MSRRPESSIMLALRGTKSRRKTPPEPTTPAAAKKIVPPPWLSEKALIEWKRITPTLMERPSMTALTQQLIATYCQTCGDLQDAQSDFANSLDGADRQRAWRRVVDARSHLLRYGVELRLNTPQYSGAFYRNGEPVQTPEIDPRIFG